MAANTALLPPNTKGLILMNIPVSTSRMWWPRRRKSSRWKGGEVGKSKKSSTSGLYWYLCTPSINRFYTGKWAPTKHEKRLSGDVIELLIYHQPSVKPSLTLHPFWHTWLCGWSFPNKCQASSRSWVQLPGGYIFVVLPKDMCMWPIMWHHVTAWWVCVIDVFSGLSWILDKPVNG